MKLPPFLLDQWLHEHYGARFNLGGSTGPRWTIGQVLDLEPESRERLFGETLVYPPTPGAQSLREAIAQMHNLDDGASIDPDEVLVVAGGSEALLLLFFEAAAPGANVLVPFPSFPPYAALPEALGLDARRYHVRPENGFRIDLREIERQVDSRTSLLMINSPHNPTGATLDNAELRELHDFAAERGIPFVSDEVFHPIYHGGPRPSAAALPHATVIGDFSKAFSLSGLRLGWIVERNAERRARYLTARQYFSISNTTVGEFVAEIAVRHRATVLGRTREVTQANLRLLDEVMSVHTATIEWVRPTGGMTGFPRFRDGVPTRAFCEAAAREGVVVVPGDCFDMPDHVRIGFGVGREWFPTAMQRLDTLFQTVAGRVVA